MHHNLRKESFKEKKMEKKLPHQQQTSNASYWPRYQRHEEDHRWQTHPPQLNLTELIQQHPAIIYKISNLFITKL